MQWFNGKPETIFDTWEFGDNPLWADYQELGPSFAAVSVLFGVEDVLPVMVGVRGCAAHLRFTKIAWGADFGMDPRPLPFVQVSRTDVINAHYHIGDEQLGALRAMVARRQPRLLALLSNDDVLLTVADLEPLRAQLEAGTGVRTEVLDVSPLHGANQWTGYDRALAMLFRPHLGQPVERKPGVNLVGWKWPSRERKHDIGACLSLLQQVGIPVNHVLPGGSRVDDFRSALGSQANLLWCPSYIGEALETLASDHGLPIAGYTPPYGMVGTTTWLQEAARAIGREEEILANAAALREQQADALAACREALRGKRGWVSGGPGRLPGLLDIMADLEVDVVAAGLYWPHPSSRQVVSKVMQRFRTPPRQLVVGPSLYELEQIASDNQFDFWMGGYQEQHTCKRHGIPFIPTTIYLASHQCYEGVITVGQKIQRALAGEQFVASVFQGVENSQ